MNNNRKLEVNGRHDKKGSIFQTMVWWQRLV